MIILDTNVVSEFIRPTPDHIVASWVDHWPADDLFITATTAAELLFGLSCMPDGRRKHMVATYVKTVIDVGFAGQILPFTSAAAIDYAKIASSRKRRGRPISIADAQIAAVCRQFSATLVTRNVKDFEHTGVEVVNPWESTPTSSG